MLDWTQVKQRQQQVWGSGDFSMIATAYTVVGELLCESVGLRAGQKVLDVATGSGNTALAAARRWCDVVGVDFVPALLERARERATCERLDISFREADAENLPLPDASFDAVLSSFGVIFAPNQEKAASEMLRVCRRGGKIGMANWTSDGFIAEILRISAGYVPPPADLPPPALWGTEARLRELLGDSVSSLQVMRRALPIRFRSVAHYLDFHRRYCGPTRQILEALDGKQQAELAGELQELLHRHNRAPDDSFLAHSEYVEVIARRC